MSLRKDFEHVMQLLSELTQKIASQLEASFRGGTGIPREERLKRHMSASQLAGEFLQALENASERIHRAIEDAEERKERLIASLQRIENSTTQLS